MTKIKAFAFIVCVYVLFGVPITVMSMRLAERERTTLSRNITVGKMAVEGKKIPIEDLIRVQITLRANNQYELELRSGLEEAGLTKKQIESLTGDAFSEASFQKRE